MQQTNPVPGAYLDTTMDHLLETTASQTGKSLTHKYRKGPNSEARSTRSLVAQSDLNNGLVPTPPSSTHDKLAKRQHTESDTSHEAEEGEIMSHALDNTSAQFSPQDLPTPTTDTSLPPPTQTTS